MKKLNYIIIFCLLSCVGKIFSSHNIPEIKIPVSLDSTESSLILLGSVDRRACEQFSLKSDPADPFCRVTCKIQPTDLQGQMSKIITVQHVNDSRDLVELCQTLQAVPFTAVVESCEKHGFNNKGEGTSERGLCFKKKGDIISSSIMKIKNHSYKVILTMADVNDQLNPDLLLSSFYVYPSFFEQDKKELTEEGLIEEVNGKFVHGNPKIFFYKKLFAGLFFCVVGAALFYWIYFCK